MNDVLVNKLSTISRCLVRIKVVYNEAGSNFTTDYTRQDSVILNLQRVCEASIDIANHLNKQNGLGIPQSSRDSFQLLFTAGLLPESIASSMKKMIGLRNIAVHDYQQLNIAIVQSVVTKHLIDFEQFMEEIKHRL